VNVRGDLAARSFGVLVGLAERGAGIALVPDFMVGEAIDAGRLQRCLPHYAAPASPVFLTYRVGSDKIQRIRTVLDLALAHVPELLAKREAAARSAASRLSAGPVLRGRRRRSAPA
jgi:DNA-binding transcriptional LysR family regulator